MKKIIHLFLLFTVVGLVGCKSDKVNTETIVGNWQVTDAELKLNNMPEGAEALAGAMKKALLETKYTFEKNGNYSIEAVFPSKGTWEFDEAQNAIILNKEGEYKATRTYRILSGSSNKLEVKNDKGEEGYMNLTLERIKEGAE